MSIPEISKNEPIGSFLEISGIDSLKMMRELCYLSIIASTNEKRFVQSFLNNVLFSALVRKLSSCF